MCRDLLDKTIAGLRWIVIGLLAGVLIGAVGGVFAKLIVAVTELRLAHFWMILLLPAAGVLIIFCYHAIGSREDKGTNTVITAIREDQEVPMQMAPLIFIATVLTHLSGGSVGREGAALQLGGSMGNALGRILRLDSAERRIVIMTGMSAAFAALFGTPLAAAVFAMEVSAVGVMNYSALVPCSVAALAAQQVAAAMGVHGISVKLADVPALTASTALQIGAMAVIFALVSVFFCLAMHKTEEVMEGRIHQEYVRILLTAAILIALTLLVGDQTYNGVGGGTIMTCITEEGKVVPSYAFLLKILFTAITLAGGFKGGEIVPALFVGATLGSTLGGLFGISTTL
ncbi:MAG: chloride channel protein, partial [Lachnospiraceae bacterium]|nr:chloride channel protein [Lachnospiraceae bacterium]